MIRRALGVLFAALMLAAAAPAEPASAEGFFESLFGVMRRPEPPPQTSAYADPLGHGSRESRRPLADEPRRSFGNASGYSSGPTSGGGHGTAFCVRTCDGRYFPLQRHAGAAPAELCKSFCPASRTAVFYGSRIDYASGPNGLRYADLDNAFAYRDKVVENCTCNGKDGLGLARVDTAEDPTLRPGDIVVTNDGPATFRGKNSRSAEFTPINPASSEWARRLSETKITRAPPAQKIEPMVEEAAKPARKSRRNVQLAR